MLLDNYSGIVIHKEMKTGNDARFMARFALLILTMTANNMTTQIRKARSYLPISLSTMFIS